MAGQRQDFRRSSDRGGPWVRASVDWSIHSTATVRTSRVCCAAHARMCAEPMSPDSCLRQFGLMARLLDSSRRAKLKTSVNSEGWRFLLHSDDDDSSCTFDNRLVLPDPWLFLKLMLSNLRRKVYEIWSLQTHVPRTHSLIWTALCALLHTHWVTTTITSYSVSLLSIVAIRRGP